MSSGGQISSANSWGRSSTQTLSAGQTLTGTGELSPYPDMMVTAKVIGGSATLYVDFSVDGGANYDTQISFSMADGVGEFHTIVKGSRTARVRLTAGVDNLTAVRIQTEFGAFRQANKANQVAIQRDDDAAVVRPSDFYQEVQEGRRDGYEVLAKTGLNPDVTTAEDIWNGGGTYTGQPENYTPETVDVFSADADDAAGDTGARTIRIEGLQTSTSTEYTTEDITLNGTTPVTSANTWWRINRAWVLTAGSSGANEGAITCRATSTTANVFFVMPAARNQTAVAAWTVPAGHTAWIKHLIFTQARANAAAGTATVTLRTREPGEVYRARRVYEMTTAYPIDRVHLGGIECPAGTDIKLRVDVVSAASLMGGTFKRFVVEEKQ